jgi:hypothetical protein
MKKIFPILLVFCATLLACDDDDIRVFEKTADERAAEAIAALKADLVAPANGWRVKYTPVDGAGSFYVLMKFFEDNKVNIKTDLAADDKSYVNQTIGYRIDNSLGIELILENYSFFHYLYEQDQATFYAEYEFEFVNKTPDNALVFVSKSDFSNKTTILFEEASPSDGNLLGVAVDENLQLLSNDFDVFSLFSSSIKVQFTNRDIVLYGGIDVAKRIFTVSAVTPKSAPENISLVNISTSYIVQGKSIVFDSPIAGNFAGTNLSINSLSLTDLSTGEVQPCTDAVPIHIYSGQTSSGDAITFESTIINAGGRGFTGSTLYAASLSNVRKNGNFVFDEIEADLPTAAEMYLMYNFSYNGEIITGMGFWLLDANGNGALVFKEFTVAFESNKLTFSFKPQIRTIAAQAGFILEPGMSNITKYLDLLAEGGNTYVFKYAEGLYEFNNLCNGWTVAFVEA